MSDDLVSEIYRPDGILPVTKETVSALATALTEARAEIERLRAAEKAKAQEWFCDTLGEIGFVGIRDYAAMQVRALAAESELSTLRARVREVVGPFAELAQKYDDTVSDGWISWAEFVADHAWPTETNCRAARQLNEDLKDA